LVGEKGKGSINEDGLGVSLVNRKPMTVVPVKVLEYDGTRRGYDREVVMKKGGNTGNARPLYKDEFFY